jgi:hypothetical protein
MSTRGRTYDFNKELLIGEIGSIVSAPTIAYVVSQFTKNTNVISTSAVLGAVFGACLFWILTRIHDQRKYKTLSVKNFAGDIAYFTPVAFGLALLIYYPSLYLGSHYLLTSGDKVVYSVILSQAAGFILFAIAMNSYRYLLFRFVGKRI